MAKWLKNDLYFLIDETLSEHVIKKYNIVQYAQVEQLKKAFLDGKDHYYSRLWLLIILHKWLIKHHP